METYNKLVKSVWPEWTITTFLGSGSYGKVYKAVKDGHGITSYSAIKIVTIPQSDNELKSLRSEGMSISESRTYLQGIVNSVVSEIKVMISLSGATNIVGVHDYKVIEKKDELSWEIHIRMELLISFEDYLADKNLSEAEVIKFGIDICTALELCAKCNPPIIHRDIKPDNIFVAQFGDFKLGDFGTARELEKTRGSYSEAGTPNYMAPEVKNRKPYNITADICSLGIVLYRLMNNNRLPFCDPNKQMLQYSERVEALDKRFDGKPLPKPINASEQMAHVILKACAFYPEARFQSATALKSALEAVKTGKYVPSKEDKDGTVRVRRAENATHYESKLPKQQAGTFGKKKSKAPLAITSVIVAIALFIGGYFVFANLNDPIDAFNQYVEEGNYVEAGNIAKDKIIDNDKKTGDASDILKDKAQATVDEYINETKSYDETLTALNNIKGLNVMLETEMAGYYDNINTLRTSRTAYESAQAYLKNEDSENAIIELRKVVEKDKNYSNAQQQLTATIPGYKESVFVQASELEGKNEFDRATSLLSQAQTLIPNDVDITARFKSTSKKQIDVIKSTTNESKDFTSGINDLRLMQTENPDSEDLKKAITDLQNTHANYIVLQAGDLSTANKFDEALIALKDGQKLYLENNTIKNAITDIQANHVSYIVSQADNLAEEKKYEDAIKLLSDNKNLYTNLSTDFQKKIDEYTEYLPVRLSDLFLIDSTKFYNYREGLFIDSFGYSYDGSYHFDASEKAYAIYNLSKSYETFRGKIVGITDSGSDASMTIQIFADEKLVYSKSEINKAMEAVVFEVDVSGTVKLTIRTSNQGAFWCGGFAIVEASLYKK